MHVQDKKRKKMIHGRFNDGHAHKNSSSSAIKRERKEEREKEGGIVYFFKLYIYVLYSCTNETRVKRYGVCILICARFLAA